MLYSMKVCPPLWRQGCARTSVSSRMRTSKAYSHDPERKRGDRVESAVQRAASSREFCVQYGETDYDFLCRMARRKASSFMRSTRKKVPTRACPVRHRALSAGVL